MHVVLLVHSQGIYRAGLKLLLAYEMGMRVVEASDSTAVIGRLQQEQIDLLILDNGISGIPRLMQYIKKLYPAMPVVVLSPMRNRRLAKQMEQFGAHVVDLHTEKKDLIDVVRSVLPAPSLR